MTLSAPSSGNLLNASLAERLALLPSPARSDFLASLTPDEQRALEYDWRRFWARPNQVAPADHDWITWLVLAGRGFGKTRIGAQWVLEQVEAGVKRIALVAETAADARDVMVEGESGIIACSPPWNKPRYYPSKRRVVWKNGAIATTYSAEEPDQLRGPQHEKAWADELAKWRYPDTWDQLQFGLRLGRNPQCVITTTPRPIPILKQLIADSSGDRPLVRITRGSTFENRSNLAPKFLQTILKKYEGTRLGRQELHAEVLDDAPGSLWKRDNILREAKPPAFTRVVVAVDPSVSSDSEQAETGIVVVALGDDELVYVLDDASLERPTPFEWGTAAVAAYHKREADRIIGEANNGGDLVEANIRAIDTSVSFKKVHAARGKQARAEPVAALYEQHRVKHVGYFSQLEDQMCQWEPGVSTWSPNRVDALVWAITELALEGYGDGDHSVGGTSTGRGWITPRR